MKTLILGVICSVCLAFAAPALATSPTQGAYSGSGANQLNQVQSHTTATSAGKGSTLPFTGFSLPILAVIAVTMIGGGFALRFKGSISDS